MNDYNPISWEQVRPGHVLMNDKRDRLAVEATMTGDYGLLSVTTAVASLSPARWSRGGFTPHCEAAPLPTKPGAYHDKDGAVCVLTPATSGEPWGTFSTRGYMEEAGVSGSAIAHRAPFTRLVPMPTEEHIRETLFKTDPGTIYGVDAVVEGMKSLLGGESSE